MRRCVTLLSIDQAAARLGKSARQIRYLISEGKLAATKTAGRWLIDSADLPLSEGQQAAVARKERQLRSAVEAGLGLDESASRQARYSVRDLKAFQIALPLFRRAGELYGDEHGATVSLRRMLEQLAIGCHRFERQQKSVAYREARDLASLAVCEMVLDESQQAEEIAGAIEQDLMAALAGLLRGLERGRER